MPAVNPATTVGSARQLVPVYATSAYAAAGQGLLPLQEISRRLPSLIGNVPLWTLVALFAASSLVWSTTVGRLLVPEPPSSPLAVAGERGLAAAELLRRTATAFPRAGTVVLARLRHLTGPVDGEPWWTVVEVDGRALRMARDADSVGAALLAAGIRLEEGDRIVVLPVHGVSLAEATAPRTAARELAPWEPPAAAAAAPDRAAGRLVVQRALPFSVVDAGVPVGARAAAWTVDEALRLIGIDVHEADLVLPPATAELLPGMRISILRARPVTIIEAAAAHEARSRASTVAELLAERSVMLGPLDRVEPPPDAPVPAEGTVRVVRGQEEHFTELRLLPFRTVTQHNDWLLPGTRLRTRAGVMGLVERAMTRVLEDGQEVRRVVTGETVLRAPVDEVIAVGPLALPAVALPGITMAPVPGAHGGPPGGERVRRVLTMEATAYDPGPISTGKRPGDPGYGITASGMRATYGVVAVDPRVIPLMTRLYIPGYGYAIAADTGGAIIGNRIDLFYPTYHEAIQFGRRLMTVYVLE